MAGTPLLLLLLLRRAQFLVLRAPPTSTVVWPGDSLELDLPYDIQANVAVAIEPRPSCAKTVLDWPTPHIVQAVAGQIRIMNTTNKPERVSRYADFCQILNTQMPEAVAATTAPPALFNSNQRPL